MKKVALFEKVSYEQWCRDVGRFPNDLWSHEQYIMLKCPARKTKGSAGYDFFAPFDIVIPPHETVRFSTGIKCYMEDGYVLELYPRSSLGFKYQLTLDNTVGIIDADYYNNDDNEGHIQCKFYNPNDYVLKIRKGEAYIQGIFKEFFLAEEEEVTTERVGGIGSTNN